MNLSKMERVELRDVWKNEAKDFSPWLVEDDNLALLSDAIGINIVSIERESSVGRFNVDVYAQEENSDRKIIIENQLEDTNHDHLGKIITYASGKDADVIIWIVKKARDEHRQAVEWLNQRTDENVGFFLVEVELWKIDNSAPAVKFNVVERPNDWAKMQKVKGTLSDFENLRLEYWQAFINYAVKNDKFASEFAKHRPLPRPQPRQWYNLSIGTSKYHITFTINTKKQRIGTEIYIRDNKEIFEIFKANKDIIERELGVKLDWREADKACRILALKEADVKKNPSEWEKYFEWYCDMALKLKDISIRYRG